MQDTYKNTLTDSLTTLCEALQIRKKTSKPAQDPGRLQGSKGNIEMTKYLKVGLLH